MTSKGKCELFPLDLVHSKTYLSFQNKNLLDYLVLVFEPVRYLLDEILCMGDYVLDTISKTLRNLYKFTSFISPTQQNNTLWFSFLRRPS